MTQDDPSQTDAGEPSPVTGEPSPVKRADTAGEPGVLKRLFAGRPRPTGDPATRHGEADLRVKEAQAEEAETSARTAWWNWLYRILFGPALLGIAVWWLAFVRTVVNRQGESGGVAATTQPTPNVAFKLSDDVMVALLTTTTATVLGLVAAVVAYLFWRGTQPNDTPKS